MKTITPTPTATTFFLPADDLRAAFQCISTEQTRYYLYGVLIWMLSFSSACSDRYSNAIAAAPLASVFRMASIVSFDLSAPCCGALVRLLW